MGECKLQIACLLVVLYIIFIYSRGMEEKKKSRSHTLYKILLALSVVEIVLDGITAFTVNHLDTVNPTLNLVLHCLFMISVDSIIFVMAIYALFVTGGFPNDKKWQFLFFLPYVLNVVVVVANMGSLEYRVGKMSNYSMGISAYTCFVMVAIYILLAVFTYLRCWNYLETYKRVGVFTSLAVIGAVCLYQMLVPDSLITSLAALMVVLGSYLNQENPLMEELSHYHDEMVMGFATLVENRDNNTGGHVRRTAAYVKLLAKELRHRGYYSNVLTWDYMKNLIQAAPMHDIGKISIPDAILQKQGKLSKEEFETMKSHASNGGEIIMETFGRLDNKQYLEMAWQIARFHHEKWNGKGYPEGLKGREIPLCARIMSIADVFDALSEDRCYRPAMPLDECFEIIRKGSGQNFDPQLAEIFLDIRPKVEEVYHSIKN